MLGETKWFFQALVTCVYLVFSVVPVLCCHVVARLVSLISNADYTVGRNINETFEFLRHGALSTYTSNRVLADGFQYYEIFLPCSVVGLFFPHF